MDGGILMNHLTYNPQKYIPWNKGNPAICWSWLH